MTTAQAARAPLQRIEQTLVKFGAWLPVRSYNSGVQHGLSIALALVRDELDALDAAVSVVPQPRPLKAQSLPSWADDTAGNETAALDLQALPGDAYIRQARLLGDVLPVSRSTLWRWVNAALFQRRSSSAPG